MPPRNPAQLKPASGLWQATVLGVLKIFLLSAGLGLLYNFSHPIGVRPNQPPALLEAGTGITFPPPQPANAGVFPNPAPAIHDRTREDPSQFHAPDASANDNPKAASWTAVRDQVRAGEAVLVDVRARSSYEAGHIPGAISVPYRRPSQNIGPFQSTETTAFLGREFTAFRKLYPADMPIVLYCDSPSCSLSKEVAIKLVEEYGYTSVLYIPGGYQEWQRDRAGD